MTEELISKYLKDFKKLNRGHTKGLGRAPHKPILLLSVLQLIESGAIRTNRIMISADLVLKFKTIWEQLVETSHVPNFALPFFHLRSEPFWFLVPKPGKNLSITKSKSIKSFRSLKETFAYAELEKDLFLLLQNPLSHTVFEQFLLDNYFSNTKARYSKTAISYQESLITNEILNEPSEIYQQQIKRLRETLKDDEFEEEVFVRGGLFKKNIPKIYDYTCCISGLKIETNENIQMVDACHIYPFSLSNDDTIPNGLALSPTMHRAFDRGLLTINANFVVRVSPSIEETDSTFPLSQFEGKQILLPEKEKWHPSQASLSWHNKEVFLL
ncbi:MAG: HNH endonuclease [Salegentibacter sp.]